MFSSTGVVVHPRRWQWVLAKCAIVMDMMAVGALIVVMLIRAVLLMLPFRTAGAVRVGCRRPGRICGLDRPTCCHRTTGRAVHGARRVFPARLGTWREQIVTSRARDSVDGAGVRRMSVGALVHSMPVTRRQSWRR